MHAATTAIPRGVLWSPQRSREAKRRSLEFTCEYDAVVGKASRDPAKLQDALSTLAQLLEFFLVGLALTEIIVEDPAIRTSADLDPAAQRVRLRLKEITAIDLDGLKSNPFVTATSGTREGPPEIPEAVPAELVQAVRVVLTVLPIEAAEALARECDADDLARTCRQLHSQLTTIARRHDPDWRQRARTVGQAYAEGRLSIPEVASALGVDVPDAVSMLDHFDFSRPVSGLKLKAAELERSLDRIPFGGEPSAQLADRCLIATQRIENVDARPWLRAQTD